jgi:hypothetical protein
VSASPRSQVADAHVGQPLQQLEKNAKKEKTVRKLIVIDLSG